MADIPVKESNAETIAVITANGQTAVSFDFLAFSAEQVKVEYRPSVGAAYLLVLNTNYTVGGLSNPNGGTITLIGVATLANDQVYIYRDTPIERLKDWQNEGDYKADLVNREQDDIYMIMQELARNTGKTISDILLIWSAIAAEVTARINGDKALASLIGQAGDIAEHIFESNLAASFAEIKPTFRAILTLGRNSSSDGEGGVYVDEPNGSADVFVSSDGRTWYRGTDVGLKRLSYYLKNNLTVKVPSQYPTIASAIRDLYPYIKDTNVKVSVEIEAGHRPAVGLSLLAGDFSAFVITSADAEVRLADTFPSGMDFMYGEGCALPTLGCMVNMNSRGRSGHSTRAGARATILPGCGIKNAVVYTLDIFNSTVEASGAIFDGCAGVRNVHVTHSGRLNINYGFVRNSADIGLYCSHGAVIAAYGVTVEDTAGYAAVEATTGAILDAFQGIVRRSGASALHARMGGIICFAEGTIDAVTGVAINTYSSATVAAPLVKINGCDQAVNSNAGSTVDVNTAVFTGVRGVAVTAAYGSKVNARRVNCVSPGSHGIYALNASSVEAADTVITGSGGIGLYSRRGSTINAEGANVSGATVNGAYALGNSRIHMDGASARKGAVDNTDPDNADIKIGRGSTVSCTGATGGLSHIANTLHGSGVIYKV